MQVVLSVNLVKLANVFEWNIFIFEKKMNWKTGYEINIAKWNYLVFEIFRTQSNVCEKAFLQK